MFKYNIIFATHNSSKIKRFSDPKLLPKGFELITVSDLGLISPEVEENGEDEFQNALIKAKEYFLLTKKIPTIALDTGFYIDGLKPENQPGKHVQRIAGVTETDTPETRYNKMIQYYSQIARRFGGSVKAIFKDVFCLWDGKKVYSFSAKREALITTEVFKPDYNFPIASIYKVPKFNKYYHQLNSEEMQEYIADSADAFSRTINAFALNKLN